MCVLEVSYFYFSREESKRYRQERNIFRAKYEDLKSKHNIVSTAKSKLSVIQYYSKTIKGSTCSYMVSLL